MRIPRLFIRELRFRWISFLIGVGAAAAVAASLVGAQGFLSAHDYETEQLVEQLERRSVGRMAELRDEARVFSKSLGFNILLLPEQQDPARLYAHDQSTHFFTSADMERLGATDFSTLNHLLPMLRQRMMWEAFGGDIVLMGIEGQIFIKAPSFQKPIQEDLAPGRVHVGDAIRRKLQLSEGDSLDLLGTPFTVHRLLPAQGNIDDITLLMNLQDMQRLLKQEDRISGVLALSCNCAAGDVEPIRQEVQARLPGAQVVEFLVRAQARQRARRAIHQGTQAELEDIQASRTALRHQIASFAGILVGLVAVGTLLLLTALAVTNIRERRTEVAMLRALGMGTGALLQLFLGKALLTGLAGGCLGALLGLTTLHLLLEGPAAVPRATLWGVPLLAAGISMLATLGPLLLAARTDPAEILVQD